MNELELNELNKDFCIFFPAEELGVFMQGFDFDAKALPDLDNRLSMFGLPLSKTPESIVFRSRHIVAGHSPDQTISLLHVKRLNPGVDFSKLEKLYKKNILLKFLWVEPFLADELSWKNLLNLCNKLVERSGTEDDVFLRFSVMEPGVLELITN